MARKSFPVFVILASLLIVACGGDVVPPGTFLAKWDGSRNIGRLAEPRKLAVDESGNVYVVDSENHRVQVFDSNGIYLRQWGSEGSGEGEFKSPSGLALDESGNVYITELGNHRVQVFDSQGGFLRKWGSEGSDDGQFNSPNGIEVDRSGNVYVADTRNNRIQVFDSSGKFLKLNYFR